MHNFKHSTWFWLKNKPHSAENYFRLAFDCSKKFESILLKTNLQRYKKSFTSVKVTRSSKHQTIIVLANPGINESEAPTNQQKTRIPYLMLRFRASLKRTCQCRWIQMVMKSRCIRISAACYRMYWNKEVSAAQAHLLTIFGSPSTDR